jgi:hypothetical protein
LALSRGTGRSRFLLALRQRVDCRGGAFEVRNQGLKRLVLTPRALFHLVLALEWALFRHC